jgi:hypothetical protein
MIGLTAKLRLATEEISYNVVDILLDHTPPSDPSGTQRRMLGVSEVVVTPQLRRWHALHTLEITYRDAYNNQLNDRYQAKWDEYRSLANEARDQTLHYGIGLISTSIPRAEAPIFSVTAGLIPSTIYYVRVSWLSATGQEGLASKETTYQTADGSLLVVQSVAPPAVAAAWNVYIGTTETTVTLQNAAPIPVGQTFTIPGTGLITGIPAGSGQAADSWVTGGRALLRG